VQARALLVLVCSLVACRDGDGDGDRDMASRAVGVVRRLLSLARRDEESLATTPQDPARAGAGRQRPLQRPRRPPAFVALTFSQYRLQRARAISPQPAGSRAIRA